MLTCVNWTKDQGKWKTMSCLKFPLGQANPWSSTLKLTTHNKMANLPQTLPCNWKKKIESTSRESVPICLTRKRYSKTFWFWGKPRTWTQSKFDCLKLLFNVLNALMRTSVNSWRRKPIKNPPILYGWRIQLLMNFSLSRTFQKLKSSCVSKNLLYKNWLKSVTTSKLRRRSIKTELF